MSPDQIFDQLERAIDPEIETGFSDFLQSNQVNRWIITADFVTSGEKRYNDVFAFTIHPNPRMPFEAWVNMIGTFLRADLKKIKKLDDPTVRFIRMSNTFSFCFIMPSNLEVNRDRRELEDAASRTIEHVTERNSGGKGGEALLTSLRSLREEIRAKKFNARLLHDTIVFTSICGFLAYLIKKHSNPALIACFPDRDKMTTAFNRICELMYGANFTALCATHGIEDYMRVELGWGQRDKMQRGEWYDVLNRFPDYLAGAIAVCNIEANIIRTEHPKVQQIIEEVIADNPRVAVLRLHFAGATEMSTHRVQIRRSPTRN